MPSVLSAPARGVAGPVKRVVTSPVGSVVYDGGRDRQMAPYVAGSTIVCISILSPMRSVAELRLVLNDVMSTGVLVTILSCLFVHGLSHQTSVLPSVKQHKWFNSCNF